MGWRPVIHLQHLEDVLLRVAGHDLYLVLQTAGVPQLYLVLYLVVSQDHPQLTGVHPHLPVEEVAAREVEERVGVLVWRVVLYIYPVMQPSLELADSHIVNRTASVEGLGEGYVVSYKLPLLQLLQQMLE